ncbi:hypothetical protein CDCA_CDCA02G0732 [Cyanidium caldarium]|uniref:TLC domain-containing protein n=1 Tax=Cyanidium caldarium TaxID=2771 RepID=A0AAV9IQY3_CYACA|nr:hypothetical protein CDCA_CDCA02G0732 [Cyanidium caldarium]
MALRHFATSPWVRVGISLLWRGFTLMDALHGQPRSLASLLTSRIVWHWATLYTTLFLAALLLYQLLPISRTYRHDLSWPERAEWISRVVSNVNAVLMTVVSAALVFQEQALFTAATRRADALDHPDIYFSSQAALLGYFVYDSLLVLLLFRSISSPLSTLLHHGSSAAAVLFCFQQGPSRPLAVYWAAAITVTEASTPLVNARWFLSFRHRHSPLYTAVGLSMLLSFLLMRVLYIPYVVLRMVEHRERILRGYDVPSAFVLGMAGGAASFALLALNLYWTGLMIRGAVKLLRASGDAARRKQGDKVE